MKRIKLPITYETPSLIDGGSALWRSGVYEQIEQTWKDSKLTDDQILFMGGNRSSKTAMCFEQLTGLKWNDVFDEGLEDMKDPEFIDSVVSELSHNTIS